MNFEQIRFSSFFFIVIVAILYLSWRSRKSASDFRNHIVEEGVLQHAWQKSVYESDRPLREDGLAVQKEIAKQLERIADALEAQNT